MLSNFPAQHYSKHLIAIYQPWFTFCSNTMREKRSWRDRPLADGRVPASSHPNTGTCPPFPNSNNAALKSRSSFGDFFCRSECIGKTLRLPDLARQAPPGFTRSGPRARIGFLSLSPLRFRANFVYSASIMVDNRRSLRRFFFDDRLAVPLRLNQRLQIL